MSILNPWLDYDDNAYIINYDRRPPTMSVSTIDRFHFEKGIIYITRLNSSFTSPTPISFDQFVNRITSWDIKIEELAFSSNEGLRSLAHRYINKYYPEIK